MEQRKAQHHPDRGASCTVSFFPLASPFLDLPSSSSSLHSCSLFHPSSLTAAASHQSQQCLLSIKYLLGEGRRTHTADLDSPWMCVCVCASYVFVVTELNAGPWCLEFDTSACYFCDWASILQVQIWVFIWGGCRHINNTPRGVIVTVTDNERPTCHAITAQHLSMQQNINHSFWKSFVTPPL